MAFSKSNLYPKDEQMTSLYAKAFSHPARLKILKRLSKNGEYNVVELLKEHPISGHAFSEHLKILREAHLITGKEKFPHTYYKIDRKNVLKAKEYLIHFLDDI